MPQNCPAALYERVEPHMTMQGPIYARAGPIYFELRDGMKIDGPFIMQICHGPDHTYVLITKP
jgi:hypothetical protein